MAEAQKVDVSEELKARFQLFLQPNEFKVGDLVCWKPDLKNRRRPKKGEPAIVVEKLDTPVYDEEKGPGSAYFREPLDFVLGFLDEEDGEFVLYHFDSRRFRKYVV